MKKRHDVWIKKQQRQIKSFEALYVCVCLSVCVCVCPCVYILQKQIKSFEALYVVCVCLSVLSVRVSVRLYITKTALRVSQKLSLPRPPPLFFFVQTCLTFPLRPEQLIFPAFPPNCVLYLLSISLVFFHSYYLVQERCN